MKKRTIEYFLTQNQLINANRVYYFQDKSNRIRVIREMIKNIPIDEDFKFDKYYIIAYIFPDSRRRIDPSNLFPSVKPAVDQLTEMGAWVDDDSTHLTALTFKYGGLSNEKGKFKIVLEIFEDVSEG